MMKTQFNHDFMQIQQKGRRIPMHLQERVEGKLNKLMNQNHIIKLDKCSDRQLTCLIVITVKKDQTVKLALDSTGKSLREIKQTDESEPHYQTR